MSSLLAVLFVAIWEVILKTIQVKQAKHRNSEKCSLELQAALNHPQTLAAGYLITIANRFQRDGEVWYTTSDTSCNQSIQVFDAFGEILYPNLPTKVVYAYVSVAAAEINNSIVNSSAHKSNHYIKFIVLNPSAKLKSLFITHPTADAPFFE